jgi:hypothetical protein
MHDVRLHRQRSPNDEALIEAAVDEGHDRVDGAMPVADGTQDSLLAPLAMHEIGLHSALRLLQAAAMAR